MSIRSNETTWIPSSVALQPPLCAIQSYDGLVRKRGRRGKKKKKGGWSPFSWWWMTVKME